MAFKSVNYEKNGSIVKLIMNRPDRLNAINKRMLEDLNDACDAVEQDKDVRVLILTGQGRAFSAGADLKALKTIRDTTGEYEKVLRLAHRTFNRFEELPVCTIAAINGLALAGGLELVMCCDLAIMSQDAKIGDQHANFGLVPSWGNTQRLPRTIGMRKAKEIMYTGDWISSQDALNYGLVNKVVSAANLDEEVMALAKKLSEKSPVATATIKRLIHSGMQKDLFSGLKMELSEAIYHLETDDCLEGLAAFNEKRQAVFKGR